MFEPVLEADPGFAPAYAAFLEEYRDEPDLPEYLALSDFARHLFARVETGDTAGFDAIFDVVERWHIDGDDYVREAASIGLLEDLQNGNLHRTTRPEDFIPWLRPHSRKWWNFVNRYWAEGAWPPEALMAMHPQRD
ncbi:hypothetical protein OF829_03035 [Sphingomonas sp. LB-2]|uniref:DUF7674 family protein n=1 Tax=Sphingomonas caeni TaxID=2984949 RepID=UPI0022324FB1|nr:hypothetical protein [Sphingomonas caeni]MCW3846198.1 hypothetical protein [Sphingomonas caeni]